MNITEVVTYTLTPQTGRRREELSFCNVLFSLLVIFIHTIAEPVDALERNSLLYFLAIGPWRLSSFVVQGFFFLSGVKLFLHAGEKDAFSLTKFWLGRLWRVVLPYLAVYVLFTVYFVLTGSLQLTFSSFIYNLFTGKLCGHFYFVILICQFYLLMPLWRRIVFRSNLLLGMVTAMTVMILCKLYLPEVISLVTGQPFDDNGLLFTSYLFYFVAGAFCGTVYERFRIFLYTYRTSLLVTWGILASVNWIFIWLNGRGIYYAPWLEIFHVLYCVYAILGCLSLGYLWKDKNFLRSSLFRLTDKWSYHVYLIHPLVIFLGNSLFGALGIYSLSLRFVLRAVLVYGTMLVLVWLISKLPSRKKKA